MSNPIERTLGSFVRTLDAIALSVGDTRISLWDMTAVLLVVFGVVGFAWIASKLARRLFRRLSRLDPTQQVLGAKLASLAIWALAVLVGIDLLGIDLTALAVFSGAFGLAIGFGLQKTFGNLIAGIIILMDRSIKPGDVIAVNDGVSNTVGQVKKIGVRAVSVTSRDRKEFLIPNENLMVNQVENWSYSSREVRIRVPITVAPSSDIDVVEKLLIQAAHASPRVLDNPEPSVWLMDFADAGIVFEMRVWIVDPEEGLSAVRSDILKRAWHLFRDNGVEFPDPADRLLYLQDSEPFRELVAAIVQRVEKKAP